MEIRHHEGPAQPGNQEGCQHLYKISLKIVLLGCALEEKNHEQEMGVPQDSIILVTGFLLKINSIGKVVNTNIDKFLFVDDFSITYSSPNMLTIEKWADENGFIFSKTKTVCMHFCKKRGYHNPKLKINNSIPMVQQTKYLG